MFSDFYIALHSIIELSGVNCFAFIVGKIAGVIIDPFKLNLVCKSFNRNFSLIEDSLVSSLAVLPAASLAGRL